MLFVKTFVKKMKAEKMQTRKDVLEIKFTNFRQYLLENSPPLTRSKLEEEILHRKTDDIWLYVQSQTSMDPEEGADRFIERYDIPKFMRPTVKRYFTCFEYLLAETVD